MSDANANFSLSAFSKAIAIVVRTAGASIVGVQSGRARASGFVWRTGLVVTASDALAEDGRTDVALPGGEVVPATLKGRDASTDIALLHIDQPSPPPASPADDAVDAGSIAIVVGAQEGAPVAAIGLVSRIGPAWRSLRGGEIDARIELDLALRTSAEGGLALDACGRAIGMAVFGPRRRVLVIPSRTIDRVAAKLESDGRIARGYLGLGLHPVRIAAEDGAAGAMVMTLDGTGPAAAAGIRQGDVIVSWNRRPLPGIWAALRELGPDSVGSVVRLGVRRAGEPVEFDVTVGASPDA